MDHTRHIGIFNARNFSATLIGAGGIGAMTALALAKMGIGSLTICDGDKVEAVNLPVQFHRLSDVGKPKARAIGDAIRDYTDGVALTSMDEQVTQYSHLTPTHIIISAVDSIGARKQIWKAVLHAQSLWYIDARMSAEYFQMFVVEMKHSQWYEDTLYSQDDASIPDDPCTSKATIYTACIAAGQIGAAVRRIVTGIQGAVILSHDIFKNQLSVLSMKGKTMSHSR